MRRAYHLSALRDLEGHARALPTLRSHGAFGAEHCFACICNSQCVRQTVTTGKSVRSRKICPVRRQKIFRFRRRPNQLFNPACLPRQEGRSRSSRPCGGMRWTRRLRLTSVATSVRRSRVGLTSRCWRQVGGGESRSRRWWQESRSPGRTRISRKAVAWGRPECSPLNLYAHVQHFLMHIAHETAGAARTRSSPRPLY